MKVINFYRYTNQEQQTELSFEPMSSTSAQKFCLIIADSGHYLENVVTKVRKHSTQVPETQVKNWIEKKYE